MRARPGSSCCSERRRSATSTGSSRSGRATRFTRSGPRGTCSRPARSSSRSLFAGNDLPGVMLSGGAVRLAALYGVRAGNRAVVATVDDRGIDAAYALRDIGVDVVAVADLRTGARVVEARGRGRVRGWCWAERRDRMRPPRRVGRERAGHVAGAAGRRRRGRRPRGGRGRRRRHARGRPPVWARLPASARPPDPTSSTPAEPLVPPAPPAKHPGKCFACLCEDVTAKDIHLSVAEGYDSIELSKRYTTATMGPCQGRMCQLTAIRLMASETGQSLEQVGTTTSRPPWHAVPMGVLAGRPFEPAKRSSIHGRHRDMGATIMWAGDWRRAYDYGDPRGEALAVHEAAGLIDVSTLGKLIVRGPDAGELLDRLYPNRLSNLKPGRIRYGVVTSDAGRIVDDGTVCRLDDETYYVTTTSSGAGAMYEWFAWCGRLADSLGVTADSSAPPPGRLARAGDHGRGDRPGLLARGVHLPRRQARGRGRRAVPDPADRLRRRGRLRAALPGRARRGALGRAARGRRGARPAAVRARAAACPAAREAAHPRSARTPTPSRTRFAAAMPWIVKLGQGAGLRGHAGRSSGSRRSRSRRRSSGSPWRTATYRPRARSCCRPAR